MTNEVHDEGAEARGGDGKSERESPLALDYEVVSELLLEGRSTEGALQSLFAAWGRTGAVRLGAIFLKRDCGWAKLAYWPLADGDAHQTDEMLRDRRLGSAADDSDFTKALRRLLSVSSITADGAPSCVPHRDGRLLGYSLGGNEEEIARLVLALSHDDSDESDESDESAAGPPLPTHVFTALGLYLYALRDREQCETLALSGDLSRRLFFANGAERGVAKRRWQRDFPEIIGCSHAMGEVLSMIRRAAPTDVSLLIHGESGTGKELVGRAIHRHSQRADGPFVSENCAAFSETLLEAEVFGSEKGAFTGADRTRTGLIERAHGGTLFLDEIGEMGPKLQSKLLRVLQEREVRRVGGDESIPVDFRLVTATHRNLDEEVRAGRFREDLLFRIQVINISIPALRDRRQDIPMLVRHFIQEIAERRGMELPILEEEAEAMLLNYDWPGNIREVRNEIERAMTLSPEAITTDSLSARFEQPLISSTVAKRVRRELGADIYSLERVVLGGVIQEVLQETGGNKAQAARILGIPKTNLYRRLNRYGIKYLAPSGGKP